MGCPAAPGRHQLSSATLLEQQECFLRWTRSIGLAEQTVAIRRFALRQFIRWCWIRGLARAEQIDRNILEEYQAHLTTRRKRNGRTLALNTQVTRLNPLKAFFKWLARSGAIQTNPAAELCVPRVPRRLPGRIPTPSEIWRIMAAPDTSTASGMRDRAILEFFYATGMRRMELARLDVSDLNLEDNSMLIRHGKANRDRMVPIGSRATKWLSCYLDESRVCLAQAGDSTLFVTDCGSPFIKNRLGDLVKGYLRKAGFTSKGACHLFRHSCATHMLENGADIRYIQELLGHADLTTTQIYTRVSIGKLKQVHSQTHPSAKQPL